MELDSFVEGMVLLFSVLVCLWAFFKYLKAKRPQRWRRRTGKVLEVKVIDDERANFIETYLNQGLRVFTIPVVRYEYSYLNKVFTSELMPLIEDSTYDYGKSSEIVARVNIGDDITIYVNPKNPKQSKAF